MRADVGIRPYGIMRCGTPTKGFPKGERCDRRLRRRQGSRASGSGRQMRKAKADEDAGPRNRSIVRVSVCGARCAPWRWHACVAHRPRHTLLLCCFCHWQCRATRPYERSPAALCILSRRRESMINRSLRLPRAVRKLLYDCHRQSWYF